ncbi:MAG: response regulator [Alcanivoracaceae bacterium]
MDSVDQDKDEYYRWMVEMANEGIWAIDADSITTFVNPKMAHMLGCRPVDMVGRHMADFMFTNEHHIAQENVARRQRGIAEQHDIRLRRADGQALIVTMGSSPIFDDDGSYLGVLSVATDITDRIHIEVREAARAETLYLLVQNAPLQTVLESIVLGVERQNPEALCTILLLDDSGSQVTLGAAPSVPGFYNDAINGAPIGPRTGSCGTALWRRERVIVEDIGSDPLWEDYRAIATQAGLAACWSEPIKSADGEVLGTFAIYHRTPHRPTPEDIDAITSVANLAALAIERANDQRHLLELNAGLEQEVQRRTAELNKAKEEAEAASRAKSDFVSNMSHEIRTPMHSIIGLTHLVRGTPLSAQQQDYLGKIDQAARHLLAIVDHILDFSRIEAGKIDSEPTDFSIAITLDSIASQLTDSAQQKGLLLAFSLDAEIPTVLHGDPVWLQQILINLVGNAIKFSDHGTIAVSAKRLSTASDGCIVRFEVRDQGIGLNKEQIKRIFNPFQQADTSTTRQYGGTGLGLAISKKLVELAGGVMGVHSTAGKGACFFFTLPLATAVSDRPEKKATAPETKEIEGMSILVVDDNPVNQMVTSELLERAGAVVHVAGDGAQALDILSDKHFDCVLMDIQMPVLDGFETTRRIRANSTLSGNTIIAMTANAASEDRRRCLEAGMDGFITKPIRPQLLYETLAGLALSRDKKPSDR